MYILLFLLILSILVFVHELGHFVAAKWCGIRVDSFALGFPPTLWKKKKGETTYKLNAIPLGGYVSIHGENYEALSPADPDYTRSFALKPHWQQLLVLVSGIVMNMLFAFLVLVIAAWIGLPGGPQYTALHQERAEAVAQEATPQERVDTYLAITYDQHPRGAGFVDGFSEGWFVTKRMTGAVVTGIGQLVSGQASINELTGPVGLGQSVAEASRTGMVEVLLLTAFISINLALINLLPFPALDGGRIVFVIIEAVSKKRIPAKVGAWVNGVGFSLLMLLMIVVTVKDVAGLF